MAGVTVFPLLAATLALAVGVAAGLRSGTNPFFWGCVAAVAVLASSAVPRRRAAWALLFAFGAAGASLGGAARERTTADCRARFADGARLELLGTLAANVVPTSAGEPPPVAPVRPERVRAGRLAVPGCTGEVRVRFPTRAASLRAGTQVRLTGRWEQSSGPVIASAWPADPRFAGTLRADGVAVAAPPRFAEHPLLAFRGATSARIRALFPRHAALVDALLLGRRETLDPALRERFTRAGLIHLLAISGSHVAVLAGAVLLLGRAFGRRVGLGRGGLAALCIALLAVYLAMIGAPASALRAGLMIALALVGSALQRPSSPFPAVAAAALVLLVWNPAVLLEPGAQLSFAGVLGVLAAHRGLLRHLPEQWLRGWRRWPLEAVAVSVAAFAATCLLTVYHFGQIAPAAMLANIPAVPLMGLALIAIVAALAASALLPPLAGWFAAAGAALLDAIDHVARLAAGSPLGAVGVARPSAFALGAVAGAGLLAWVAARRLRAPLRWAVGIGTAAAAMLALPVLAAPAAEALEIHFIDVGQGDAVAVRTPAGRWVLVDAGPREERWDAGERRVLPFLRSHGAGRLEALVLTHPDADHVGGAPAVLRGTAVGRLVEPGLPVGKPLYLETLRAAEAAQVPWSAARNGEALRLDGVEFHFLAPDAETVDAAREANEISVVMLIRFGAFRALLTGDLADDGEARLAAREGAALRAQVLKVGHHGSRTSTSDALLDAVQPEIGVISAGRRNRYGHPAPETLARLRRRRVATARTDREGTISLRARADGSWERLRP